MADRQDALVAASELVLAVREEVTRIPGRQVGTVGRLDATPNAANVIPGRVEVSIELRDLSAAKLETLRRGHRTPRAGDRRAHEDDDCDRTCRRLRRGAGRRIGDGQPSSARRTPSRSSTRASRAAPATTRR